MDKDSSLCVIFHRYVVLILSLSYEVDATRILLYDLTTSDVTYEFLTECCAEDDCCHHYVPK
jgi:hypothetical protein